MPDTQFLFEHNLNEARESLFRAMRVHDQAAHGGQSCVQERVNAMAWLCHALGLTADNLLEIGELLSGYDQRHHEHHQPVSEAQKATGH